MPAPFEFWFDFSSPYGYIAAELIDGVPARHDRKVNWHPILLGVVFRQTGGAPLTEIPIKGDYSKRDFARSARYLGLAFRMPTKFPLATQNAARAFLWLQDRDPARAGDFAHVLYRACFAEDVDISDTARLLAIADGDRKRQWLPGSLSSAPQTRPGEEGYEDNERAGVRDRETEQDIE